MRGAQNDIRRATRRQIFAEDKTSNVLAAPRGDVSIAELCAKRRLPAYMNLGG